MKVVIMAGGRGERLWPLSRIKHPKQLVKFPLPDTSPSDISTSTLLSQTLQRLESVVLVQDIFLSIQETIFKQTREALPQTLSDSQFILEPQAKDTTTAILLSLLTLTEGNSNHDEVFFFTPADHYITPLKLYTQTLLLAEKVARTNEVLTVIGIAPQHPSTDYGYLETHPYQNTTATPRLDVTLHQHMRHVSQFHEKPSLKRATAYLEKGNFLWNAGMFFCKASTLLTIFRELVPEHVHKVQTYLSLTKKEERTAALRIFNSIDKISFDYAIAEKLTNILCIPAKFIWDDLGSFAALERLQRSIKTTEGNIFLNETHAFATQDTFVHNTQEMKQTLVVNGIQNLSVIVTEDVIYIADKTRAVPTKDILKTLAETRKQIL